MEPRQRFRAVYVLGLYGDARAIPILTSMLSITERPSAASWSIGEQAKRELARLASPDESER